LRLCQQLIPLMQGRGCVVNVSSGMGQLSDMNGCCPGYRLSKTALNAVTRIFADELQGTDIRVNSAGRMRRCRLQRAPRGSSGPRPYPPTDQQADSSGMGNPSPGSRACRTALFVEQAVASARRPTSCPIVFAGKCLRCCAYCMEPCAGRRGPRE
jgi:NAD(P)-dependent dehydrogenase (short-subunit alcohol dehydrogenase family)